jgi:hypothetical protein
MYLLIQLPLLSRRYPEAQIHRNDPIVFSHISLLPVQLSNDKHSLISMRKSYESFDFDFFK